MHYLLQAVVIASEVFGDQHPKYADTLIDYGFYLLSVDAISQGVQVYQVIIFDFGERETFPGD